MLRAILIAFMALATATNAAARADARGDQATIDAASRYLDAYQKLDLVELEKSYAEGAAFEDPTSLMVQGIGGPFVWRGRETILAGIRSWTQSISSLRYDVDDIYESSGRVVFVGAVNPVVATAGGSVQYRYRIVTIVTVENGLVVEHRDYTDYAGAVQVAAGAQ
jgi:ketosteroid isomerase-like protein